ncbi:hypothetical protein [Paraburkholderia sp. EG304]|uniref:hypothetical protein n=1 Tax=Paraburkholderia sp. EG304 TaxID=3237015 RepID=UPI00397B2E8C
MNVRKAMQRAQAKSLDGHCRFVAQLGRTAVVLSLSDLAHCPKVRIQMAFERGREGSPR